MLIILLALFLYKQAQAHAKMFQGCNIHVSLKWGYVTLWCFVYKKHTHIFKDTQTHGLSPVVWLEIGRFVVVWLAPCVIAGELPQLPKLYLCDLLHQGSTAPRSSQSFKHNRQDSACFVFYH